MKHSKRNKTLAESESGEWQSVNDNSDEQESKDYMFRSFNPLGYQYDELIPRMPLTLENGAQTRPYFTNPEEKCRQSDVCYDFRLCIFCYEYFSQATHILKQKISQIKNHFKRF